MLTPDIKGMPSPSTLLVKVSADGHPLEVKGLRPSNDLQFEALARPVRRQHLVGARHAGRRARGGVDELGVLSGPALSAGDVKGVKR